MVYANSVIAGSFQGHIISSPFGKREIRGTIHIKLSDEFKDPISIAERITQIQNKILHQQITEKDLYEWIVNATNFGGTIYPISADWEITLNYEFDTQGVE